MKKLVFSAFLLGAGLLAGFIYGSRNPGNATAQTSTIFVDGATLDTIYDAVFHRPPDAAGRSFHLGRNLRTVLNDFSNSQEMAYYGALFQAVKAYEEAQRAPGTLTDAERQNYLDLIDSALSNIIAWVDTLPEQDPCRATIGPERARQAVMTAYNRLDSAGKAKAENGLLNASRRIGPPSGINISPKCTATPTPSVSVTPTPSVTPSPTPSATPTPTPSPTVTPTPTPTP